MDFKSLITKISSMDSPIETVAAPELPKAVQLNEDAELRVLAGTSSYIAEAKKQEEEKVAEDMKVGDSKKTAKGGTVTKTKTGIVHKAAPGVYGGSDDKDTDPDADDEPKAKKAKKESIDPEAFRDKFSKMVEAKKAKPDFLDMDKDGNKKEPMKKAVKDKKKGAVKEAAKPDYIDLDKDGNKKEPMKKAAADKKKKTVKESVEPKLTFKDMIKLVQESGGQQQIDPKDKELFAWAQRVANSKFNEGMKAEVYAGLVYERMGGVFEMYDVLAEDQK